MCTVPEKNRRPNDNVHLLGERRTGKPMIMTSINIRELPGWTTNGGQPHTAEFAKQLDSEGYYANYNGYAEKMWKEDAILLDPAWAGEEPLGDMIHPLLKERPTRTENLNPAAPSFEPVESAVQDFGHGAMPPADLQDRVSDLEELVDRMQRRENLQAVVINQPLAASKQAPRQAQRLSPRPVRPLRQISVDRVQERGVFQPTSTSNANQSLLAARDMQMTGLQQTSMHPAGTEYENSVDESPLDYQGSETNYQASEHGYNHSLADTNAYQPTENAYDPSVSEYQHTIGLQETDNTSETSYQPSNAHDDETQYQESNRPTSPTNYAATETSYAASEMSYQATDDGEGPWTQAGLALKQRVRVPVEHPSHLFNRAGPAPLDRPAPRNFLAGSNLPNRGPPVPWESRSWKQVTWRLWRMWRM